MANKENLPPTSSPTVISRLSPNNKPALSRQRDHSACRRPETPLKVRKTRENLRQQSVYPDIPPPCVHAVCESKRSTGPSLVSSTSFVVNTPAPISTQDAPQKIVAGSVSSYKDDHPIMTPGAPPPSTPMQRQKSISQRVLSRVKHGMSTTRSRSVRPAGSETSLVRRISGRRRRSREGCVEPQRAHSFDVARDSVDETLESGDVVSSVDQRSCSESTVSTAELLGQGEVRRTPDFLRGADGGELVGLSPVQSSSSSLNPTTPRPPPRSELPVLPSAASGALHVPCVDLNVTLSSTSVDLHSKHDIWVAIEAHIRTLSTTPSTQTAAQAVSKIDLSSNITQRELNGKAVQPSRHSYSAICGTIPTLRLCYKPVGGCSIREVVGQKSFRDLSIGQQCSLFIKVHIPRLRIKDPVSELDQHSLFAELESIVGTLKMEILHVEVRYRHSLLPIDNVVTVRQTCKVKRPKMESRWSRVGIDDTNMDDSPSGAHALLAKYLASHFEAEEALGLLQRYLDPSARDHPIIREFRESSTMEMHRGNDANSAPSVVVTDSELDVAAFAPQGGESCSMGLSPPGDTGSLQRPQRIYEGSRADLSIQNEPQTPTAPSRSTKDQPSTPSPSPTTSNRSPRPSSPSEPPDSARQLWRHIRRNSLSATQHLDNTLNPPTTNNHGIQHLDIYDDATKALHRQAVANKRSIGAETLRAWKWEHSVSRRREMGEAPWM